MGNKFLGIGPHPKLSQSRRRIKRNKLIAPSKKGMAAFFF
jgi:hypothetical protein